MALQLEHTTAEAIAVTITSRVDPTGDPIEFNLTTAGTSPSGDWYPGTWSGDWDPVSGDAAAFSPVLTGDMALEERTTHTLWVRWTMGPETPVHSATIFAT